MLRNNYPLERVSNALLRRDLKYLGLSQWLLNRRNKHSKSSLLSPEGPAISLTTHGSRLETVHLTIETIASGSLLPSRLVLWLNEPSLQSLPDTIKRLENRGLEVREAANFGPHTKYYPFVASMENSGAPLITADDDVLYPRDWAAGLVAAYQDDPDILHCHRAHSIQMNEGTVGPYASWGSCRSTEPSFLHFATAVSGNILPPRLLRRLKAEGTKFMSLCPKADDIWVHVMALREGLRIQQVRPWQRNFPEIPGTQAVTLSHWNFHQSQNDVQILKTYTAGDLDVLLSEANEYAAPAEMKTSV